jgi:hypothetical protein
MPLAFFQELVDLVEGVKSAHPFVDKTLVMAAVRVVLPWSICPMVPTFTWGFVLSNFFLATIILLS